MTLGIIIFAIIGWIGGVHLPWWGVLISWAIGSYIIYKKNNDGSGLEGMVVVMFVLAMVGSLTLGHVILGDSFTFKGVGDMIGYLLTGS